ncbi:hypothetical protein AgCh_009828 [Apium graveolens]
MIHEDTDYNAFFKMDNVELISQKSIYNTNNWKMVLELLGLKYFKCLCLSADARSLADFINTNRRNMGLVDEDRLRDKVFKFQTR